MAISGRDLTLILRVQSAGTGNIRALSRDLAALERSGLSFNERFARASQALGAFGRQAQLAGGIATAALGFAANSAANLQTQVTLAATQVGNTTGQVAKVATRDFQGILNQMTKFPTASSDMAGALYDIYSTLNVTSKQGLPILTQINKAAVAFGLTARDAGNGLLTIMSNFKEIPQTAGGAEKAFTRLGAAVRFGRLTMEQLQAALQTTAPAAKIAGQSLDNMAGTVAFLSRSLGANKASVGYARLVEVLSGQQMQDGLKKMGVNIDTAGGKMKQLDQVIQILVKRFPYLAKGGIAAQNFFKSIGGLQGTIQARRAFATLVKDVGGYRDILGKTVKDNNEFKKSYEVMAKSLGIQWGVLLNTLKSIALQLGLAVIPAFVEMSKPIKEAIAWFEKLDPSVKANIGRLVAFGSVIALVGGTIITMVAGLAVAITSIAELGGAASIFVTGAAAYGTLAALGVRIYQNWDALKGLFQSLGKTLLAFFRSVGQAVQAFLRGDWSNVWSHLGDAVKQGTTALLQSLNIMKVSTLKWLEDFAFTLQGAMTAAIAGMFAANKIGGRSKLAEGVGSKLSTTDLLSLVVPMGGVSTVTRGAAKADDIGKALSALPFLGGRQKATAGRAILASGDIKKIAEAAPYLPAQQRAVAQELIARDKVANSWRNQTKQMAQANVIKKQMATLDALEQKRLVASSLIRDKQAGIMRTTGGFASAREAQAGMALLSQTPGKVTALETATAAASVGFSKLGSSIGSAGKSMLNFLGFGISPYLGAAVAGAAATYAFVKIMDSLSTSLQEVVGREKDAALGLKQTSDTAKGASVAYNQYSSRVDVLKRAIADTQKTLSNAKGGTNAYRSALSLLSQQQDELKTATEGAAAAQQTLSNNIRDVITQIQKFPTTSLATLQNVPAARQVVSNVQGVAGPNAAGAVQLIGAKNTLDASKKATEAVRIYTAAYKDNATAILQTTAAGQKLTASQKELLNVMGSIAQTHIGDLPQLSRVFNTITPQALQLVKVLGRIPQNMAGFAAFANSLPRNVIPAVQAFMKITGQAPNIAFTEKLVKLEQASKGAAKEMAVFVGTFARVPTTKETKFLFHRPPWLTAWITHFIAQFHKMPTTKQINLQIKGHKQAEQRIDEVERRLNRLNKKAAEFTLAHGTAAGGRTPFSGAIQQAQRELNKIKAPHLKGIMKFTVQGDAFKALPGQAKTAATAAGQNLVPLIGKAKGVGNSAGAAWAAGFQATATAQANATVNITVHELKKAYKISSPSKVIQKEIGDPILQGILGPLKDKKSISDAANTAMDNMVSAFNANKDTFQQQMGDIFGGTDRFGTNALQDKISWGARLNIKDLRKNLELQNRTFAHYQRGLRNLAKRPGASPAFIEMLRQAGPQDQPELDALLKATPRQIRAYVRMWKRGQNEVTNAAKLATHTQLRMWRGQGAAVALGFMSGMESHSAQMARYFRKLFLDLFHQVKRVHKSHSPSKLYMDEGMRVAQGFQLGVARGLLRPVGGFGRPLAASVGGGHTYNTTYNIHQAKDESLLGTMRRHDFITRTRR